VERTLLHDRDVLLRGNHLQINQSVIVELKSAAGIRTLSDCCGRLDLSSLKFSESKMREGADGGCKAR